ncbi:hypothetical protein Tco_0158569 [Tanacetum coccineum]
MQEDPYIHEETLDRARDEKFAQWFKEHIQSNGGNEHLKVLARGPMRYVESHKGYFVNGYKFHTLKHGDRRVTHNSGVCVKGSTYNEFESDYYGLLVEVLAVNYHDSNGRCVVVLFKCDWFEPIQGRWRCIYEDANFDNGSRAWEGLGHKWDIAFLYWWLGVVMLSGFGNNLRDSNYDNGSRSGGRGKGICGNIGKGKRKGKGRSEIIGGRGSSNVSRFGNQEDANYDNGSRSGGRGRGISGNIGIVGSCSNVSGFGNQEEANYDNGSRIRGRGRGIGRNIGIGGGSNVSGFRNQDADYDNGRRSGGRGRGRSENIGGRGSSSTSRSGNPDADFDTNDNETETETSQRVRGSNLVQSIPNHPSQRPMIALYYGGFAEPHVTRDIIIVYKSWERVMSSRYSDILGQCRRNAAHRATMDNITVGNDLSVLKPYTPSWKDQAHWDNMIDRLEALGSGMDEASEGRTREYVTASSKRVADVVKAAIVEKHRPDASEHPPNDFDLWGEATRGRKKGWVQTLEETIRRLLEENTQMRSQNQREMQIEIQRQVEHQVLEHMRQRELEANAREQAREREWQQRMNDINSVLRKFTDSRPPP